MADARNGANTYDQDWELQFLDGNSIDDDLAQYGEDELIVDALKVGGGDLLQYARKLEADLRRKETEAIEDYVNQTAGVADLRLHVEECDEYLKMFEQTLIDFQNDLGQVGAQIKDMNARAQALDTLATNRRQVEHRVSGFIQGGSLPKRLAKAVHEEPIGASYAPLLHTLEAKRSFFASKAHAQTAMAAHVIPVLDRLQTKALERVTSTLLQRVKALPHQLHSAATFRAEVQTAASAAPYEEFCSMAPMVAFVRRYDAQGYQEVVDKFVESMRAGLASQLRHSEREASRYQVEVLKHGDTLYTPGPTKGFRAVLSKGGEVFSRGAKKEQPADNHREVSLASFELNERLTAVALVEEPDAAAFDPTEEHPPEFSLGAVVAALISKIEAQQHLICTVFPHHPPDILLTLFQTALQGVEEWAAAAVRDNEDPLSLLICIRILQGAHDKVEKMGMRHLSAATEGAGQEGAQQAGEHRGGEEGEEEGERQKGRGGEAQRPHAAESAGEGGAARRKEEGAGDEVSEMEGVFSGIFMALWPRFKGAIEAQVESLKAAGGSASMPSGSDKSVHSITTRYAQLTAGLFAIFGGLHSQSAAMAGTSLTYMSQAMDKFVQRGGETLGGGLKHLFFAINQYDHILSVYHLSGILASACAPVRSQLRTHAEALQAQLLGQAYKDMVETVDSVNGGAALQEKQAKKLADDFAKGYTTALSTMHECISGSVCSATLGRELHKTAACQLLLTYGAFRGLVEHHLAGTAVCEKLIAEAVLIEEIKKYDVSANFLDG